MKSENQVNLEGIFENGYGTISKKVMQYDKEKLDIYAKAVYSYICSYTGGGSVAFPSRLKICSDLGISKNKLTQSLKVLKDNNFLRIKQIRKGGNFSSNIYEIVMLPCTTTRDTVEMDATLMGPHEGVTNNNKENNNKLYNNNKENNNNTNSVSGVYNISTSIYDFIQENFGVKSLTPIEIEEISTWEDNDLTRYAIKQAVLNGKCNIKYISRILYSYQQNNIQTVKQAQMREEDFQKQKLEYQRRRDDKNKPMGEWKNGALQL